MKKIFFYDKKQCRKFMAFGQMLELMWACYIKGKELGYDKIVVEWHDMISIRWFDNGICVSGMITPKKGILPLEIVSKGTIINDADRYIDISEPNVLYNECPPLISNYKIRAACYGEYLSRNYKETKIKPLLEINKSNIKDKYILIHYRHSEQQRQADRNVSDKHFIKLINLIKERHKDYKIYKIGEPSSFDSLVDREYKYFLRDTEKLISLVGNSSLYIGALSGPISIALFSQHPCIGILSKRDLEVGNVKHDYYSSDTIFVSIEDNYLEDVKEFMDKIL